jgi:hypothetical protein
MDPSSSDEHSHQHTNRIQISNTKKPLFFYVNLAKQFLGAHETVHLSGMVGLVHNGEVASSIPGGDS